MARLTDKEKQALRESVKKERGIRVGHAIDRSPSCPMDYLVFAEEASKFFKGSRRENFCGDHWKL